MEDNVVRRKLVIVGDGACGKTSLLYVFTIGEFPTEYHPTVFENYVINCRIDGKAVQLALWDTAGQEEYERLRPLSYTNSHVILIAFAIDVPDSLENARTKWVEEVQQHSRDTPYLLIGLKKDLRADPNDRKHYVQPDQGVAVAREINAKTYLESSALTGEGVDDIFEFATRTSLLVQGKAKHQCCIVL
ncbi:Piso0_001817 [Millerozyma farinosa CBS 7064]|uniref:Piso0_001817 protein n=1 Tax=Pichia sorbitophila (strain ATCC MYA-4447 / BCRC 22081 / CBS 7064 / NBRC 10061 / NRRL Y-12695) TaxID=559304 RepID=G8YP63_PICSO|nr:Piso0_001817 [Millerozyma farinosa CBS 7064]